MQRPQKGAAYWLAPHGLFSLLSYRTKDHQTRLAPPTMGWALPYQSLIKKMFYRLAHSQILGKHFLNQSSLLSDDSRLCQVDINLSRTTAMLQNQPRCSSAEQTQEFKKMWDVYTIKFYSAIKRIKLSCLGNGGI